MDIQTLESRLYTYRAACLRVVDGDTVDLDIDQGLHQHAHERVRLYGIDAPEVYGVAKDSEEYRLGMLAKERLEQLIVGKKLWIETHRDKTEKYGRYLAVIWTEIDGSLINVNETLVNEGLVTARSY